ncbi:MAG: hypothetical protein AAB583_07115 [Patescibacteria group bacterium]
MQRLIPTIYFYVLSAVGMVLFIIGLFNSIHYVVGVTAYDKYPLGYAPESRCEYMPKAVLPEGQTQPTKSDKEAEQKGKAEFDSAKEECLKSVETERQNKKVDDLEKSLAFTIIGLLVFGSHFYFARRRTE